MQLHYCLSFVALALCIGVLPVNSNGRARLHRVEQMTGSCYSKILIVFAMIAACALVIPAAVSQDEHLELEVNRKLKLFCEGGLLRDRGVGISILAGNSDFLIMEFFAQEKSFCNVVGVSKETFMSVRDVQRVKRVNGSTRPQEEFVPPLQFTDSDSVCVRAVIPADDLACVYFQLEGLMALCRPEVAKLVSLNEEDRQKILEMVKAIHTDEVYPATRALFSLNNNEAFEEYHYRLTLRKASVQLDNQILDVLNATERERLVEIISKSLRFRKIIEDTCGGGNKKN